MRLRSIASFSCFIILCCSVITFEDLLMRGFFLTRRFLALKTYLEAPATVVKDLLTVGTGESWAVGKSASLASAPSSPTCRCPSGFELNSNLKFFAVHLGQHSWLETSLLIRFA